MAQPSASIPVLLAEAEACASKDPRKAEGLYKQILGGMGSGGSSFLFSLSLAFVATLAVAEANSGSCMLFLSPTCFCSVVGVG